MEGSKNHRFCAALKLNKKGTKEVKCTVSMFAELYDPHTICAACRGSDCATSTCNECVGWSKDQRDIFNIRHQKKRARRLASKLFPLAFLSANESFSSLSAGVPTPPTKLSPPPPGFSNEPRALELLSQIHAWEALLRAKGISEENYQEWSDKVYELEAQLIIVSEQVNGRALLEAKYPPPAPKPVSRPAIPGKLSSPKAVKPKHASKKDREEKQRKTTEKGQTVSSTPKASVVTTRCEKDDIKENLPPQPFEEVGSSKYHQFSGLLGGIRPFQSQPDGNPLQGQHLNRGNSPSTIAKENSNEIEGMKELLKIWDPAQEESGFREYAQNYIYGSTVGQAEPDGTTWPPYAENVTSFGDDRFQHCPAPQTRSEVRVQGSLAPPYGDSSHEEEKGSSVRRRSGSKTYLDQALEFARNMGWEYHEPDTEVSGSSGEPVYVPVKPPPPVHKPYSVPLGRVVAPEQRRTVGGRSDTLGSITTELPAHNLPPPVSRSTDPYGYRPTERTQPRVHTDGGQYGKNPGRRESSLSRKPTITVTRHVPVIPPPDYAAVVGRYPPMGGDRPPVGRYPPMEKNLPSDGRPQPSEGYRSVGWHPPMEVNNPTVRGRHSQAEESYYLPSEDDGNYSSQPSHRGVMDEAVPPLISSRETMSVEEEDPMDTSGQEEKEEKPRMGYDEVLKWFHQKHSSTRPTGATSRKEELCYRYLRSDASETGRTDYRLPMSAHSVDMDTHFQSVIRGETGGKPLTSGQFIAPSKLPVYLNTRDYSHFAAKQVRPSAWKNLTGPMSPKHSNTKLKDWDNVENLERRRCQIHSFVDWHLTMFDSLLDEDVPDKSMLRHAFTSLAQAINRLHMESMIATANRCLSRRDAEISRLPQGVSDDTKKALRSSSFIEPLLFEDAAVSKAEEEIKVFTTQTSIRFLSSFQPSTNYQVRGGPATQRGIKRHGDATRGGQKRARPGNSQRGRGLHTPKTHEQTQGFNPPPPPASRRPFRGAASGRGYRGGRVRK